MQLTLTVRELEAEDLVDLDWSGGAEHVLAVAQALTRSVAGEAVLLAVALDNGRLIATGAADFDTPGAGTLSMLAVHETFQGLGVGTLLVGALEERVRARGVGTARIAVEHDNPRAAALYRRLGYRESRSALESWPVAGGRTYVTVSTVLDRELGPSPRLDSGSSLLRTPWWCC